MLRDAGDVLSPGAADSLASCLTSELKDEDESNRRCLPCGQCTATSMRGVIRA